MITETSRKASRSKSVKALLFLLAVVAAQCLKAGTETIDGCTWTYRVDGDEAEVTKVSPKPTGTVTVPSALGGKRVTSIGDSTFGNCSGLVNVTMPKSVRHIGRFAFMSCRMLMSVTIPKGVESVGAAAFADCRHLANVTVPASVREVGDDVFVGCGKLECVKFEGDAPTMGIHVFGLGSCEECCVYVRRGSTGWGVDIPGKWNGVAIAYLPEGKTMADDLSWKYTVSNGEVSLGSGRRLAAAIPTVTSGALLIPSLLDGKLVTSIGNFAFCNCGDLTSVTIPDCVTNIDGAAFYLCRGLTSVTIPGSVKSIGQGAFAKCSGLANVTIGDGVTSIGQAAFSDCGSLASVTIPDSVTSVGDYAFENCSGLVSVTIGSGVTNIGNYAFQNCGDLANVSIPAGMKCIGGMAFFNCKKLTHVTIPAGLTRIKGYAFSGCSGLTSIEVADDNAKYLSRNGLLLTKDGERLVQGVNGNVAIPDGVTSIAAVAFHGLGNLTSVTIPASVTRIGDHVFSQCCKLERIVFEGNAPELGCNVFGYVSVNGDTRVAEECCAYVRRGSTGWGVEIPGKWNGIAIDYLPDAK